MFYSYEECVRAQVGTTLWHEFTQSKKRAIARASCNGNLLRSELNFWREDSNVVLAAIKNTPFAIRHAPKFQGDKVMGLIAVRLNGLAKIFLDPALQRDPEIERASELSMPKEERFGRSWEEDLFFAPSTHCPPLTYLRGLDGVTDLRSVSLRSGSSRFIRDSRIILFSGTHLLPYSIKTPFISHELMALLPLTATHFFFDPEDETRNLSGFIGKGFDARNVEEAMRIAYEEHISFKRSVVTIEGGNALLSEGRAFVGEISLYTSFIGLREQGFFEHLSGDPELEPSEQAYRMARNLALYHSKQRPFLKIESQSDEEMEDRIKGDIAIPLIPFPPPPLSPETIVYRKQLIAPLTPEEKLTYLNEARLIEAQLRETRAQMAQALEVPETHLMILPQTIFHIDMEMTATPTGELVVHEDQDVLTFLQNVAAHYSLNADEEECLAEYRTQASLGVRRFKAIRETRVEMLRTGSIASRTLPLVLARPTTAILNYSNGVFIPNKRHVQVISPDGLQLKGIHKKGGFKFLTTGPSDLAEGVFHKSFVELFERTFPDLTLEGIPGLSKFVAMYHGGAHCLSFERALPQ